MDIFAQILGLIAAAILIIAFQFRSNRTFFIMQMTSGFFFAASMFLLGAYGGFILNMLAALRGVILSLPQGKGITKPMFWVVNGATVICYALLFYFSPPAHWIDWLLPLQFMVGTFFSWRQDGRALRLAQLSVISPVCLIYNINMEAIGGILTECFNIVSIVISLIRFGWNGFERTNANKENANV